MTILYRRTRKEMPADAEEVQVALDEGVRLQELVNLDVGDVRLDEKRLIIRHSKGDRQVEKFLNTALRQMMKRYLAERKKAPADSPALFLSNRHERISPRQIAFRLEYWLKEAGIKVLFCSDGNYTEFVDDVAAAGRLRARKAAL